MTSGGLNLIFELAEERITELETRSIEIIQFEEQKEKSIKMNRTLEKNGTP